MRASHGRFSRRGDGALLLVLGMLLLLALAPALAHAQADTLVLVWTAPGDDGTVGRATNYDLRMSTGPIDAGNYDQALQVGGLPAPANAGARQRTIIRGLTRGTTYYFALKSTDDVGNTSTISNVLRWDWVFDTAPPAAPSGLTVANQSGAAHLHWAANAEPDLAGYTVYRAEASGGPWTAVSGSLLATNDYVDTSIPFGVNTVWYRVSASDGSGNESARSAAVTFNLGTTTVASIDWHLDPAYPNPSRTIDQVRIPITVPAAGGAGAEAQIVDAGRRVVRRLDLGSLTGGNQEFVWDGRNDGGRPVAPGVYTIWLTAGSTRTSLRLVRVP
jgi:hypothetical protein